MTDHDLQVSIDRLTAVETKILRTNQWWYSLLHGLMVGIGGTVGVALVATVLLAVLNRLTNVPGADTARDLIQRSVTR